MCMYVAHWNIFMVNKRDLYNNKKERKKTFQWGRDSSVGKSSASYGGEPRV